MTFSRTKRSLVSSAIALLLCFALLLGTTFAWFTDSVTSGGNTIVAGNLKVDLLHKVDSDWISLKDNTTHKVFDYDKWEPGYTGVETLKAANLGSLALQYRLSLSIEAGSEKLGKNGENLADVIEVYVTYAENTATSFADIKASSEWTYKGTLTEVIESPNTFIGGELLPADKQLDGTEAATTAAGNQVVSVALHMQESAGNEYQELSVGNVYVNLIATQWSYEMDSFGKDYDEDANLPAYDENISFTTNVSDKLDADNKLTEDVTIGDGAGKVSAVVPAGTPMKEGATELTLTVKSIERSGNIEVTLGEASRSLDVHVEGLADGNTVPVFIDLGVVMPTGLKSASVVLYHVENGTPVKMESVQTLTAHNQFIYNSDTGEVSICLASFSEITAVVAFNDPWDGSADTSWYNTTDTTFTITTAEQLAGLGAIVGGMAEGIAQDEFVGKTIILGDNLDLGGLNGRFWLPIGYYFTDDKDGDGIHRENAADIYCSVYSFEGTFDGNGHIITNILQRTWDIKGDDPYYNLPTEMYYNDGMGLFGFVYNGTVKNLTVNNFQSDGEFSTTGCVAAYAAGNATFENITVTNSNPRAYNVPNGGVVGYAYGTDDLVSVISFTNIKVDASNKISALWGSWDVGCGGILGRVNGNATVNMTDCEVGAVIDVYNDVCGNYQYYQYRYSGMLIGTVGPDSNPTTGPEKVNFSGVKVYIGNWADYYYCEFEKNSIGSYTEDYQFSRVEKNEINIDPATNLPYTQNLSPCRHQHTANEDKMGLYLPFDQLYTGYGWGSSPQSTADGVEIIHYFYTVTYMDGQGKEILGVDYVTEGERSETKLWANAYTVKSGALTENPGKQFVGWVNANSEKVSSIAAGNNKDVLLYESWQNPYIIRFVDIDGNIVYSESWTSSNEGLSGTPGDPPKIEGYVGTWEAGWQDKLKNVTADVTIKPVYVLEEYADEDDHVLIDSTSSAKDLFTSLEQGKSVLMGADISASGKGELGISGGKTNLCVMDDNVNSRLNLNSFEFTCTFDHNANKSWHVFDIYSGSTLTVSGGVSGDGVMVINFKDVKSDVYLFNVRNGGKLVLEAGLTFVVNYPDGAEEKVYGFMVNGVEQTFDDYTGIYVYKSGEGKLVITVGVTTVIEPGATQQS